MNHINEKGQCSECLKKPRPYKRQGFLWCSRCGSHFSFETGQEIPNPYGHPKSPSEKYIRDKGAAR